ncbi:hypothetical protein HPG69_003503 [Diceros bicornis minor]|uniref:Uncharacterized protein n=1 Tax=Diceros bicornis minor TaxID=77932 RepID=A0A7J7F9N4_DICBM|nr:hypothetical protein HPG69_003503 [Diceros bicornis minor]
MAPAEPSHPPDGGGPEGSQCVPLPGESASWTILAFNEDSTPGAQSEESRTPPTRSCRPAAGLTPSPREVALSVCGRAAAGPRLAQLAGPSTGQCGAQRWPASTGGARELSAAPGPATGTPEWRSRSQQERAAGPQPQKKKSIGAIYHVNRKKEGKIPRTISATALDLRTSPSLIITLTSEAGENDKAVQTRLTFTYSEKYPDEAPFMPYSPRKTSRRQNVSNILKLIGTTSGRNPWRSGALDFSISCARKVK